MKPDDEVADVGDGVPVPELSRPAKARHRGIDLNQELLLLSLLI